MAAALFFQTAVPALLFGGVASIAAYGFLTHRAGPDKGQRPPKIRTDRHAAILVFEGRRLVSGPEAWEELVHAHRDQSDDWAQFLDVAIPHVPALSDAVRGPIEVVEATLVEGSNRITGVLKHGMVSIRIEGPLAQLDPSRDYSAAEVEMLRATLDQSDVIAWRQTEDGEITWINTAYLEALRDTASEHDHGLWPPRSLFAPEQLRQTRLGTTPRRVPLAEGSTRPGWYSVKGKGYRSETLFTAESIDGQVDAETRLREHTQGLAKTVEGLAVGLALFDRSRRLVLFNPALTRMTSLSLEFLGTHPTLLGFLDRLREARIMPEPKDYAGWRMRMADLEAAAAENSFEETWSLADGQTYRVTGHPHAEGALVFLFEDISTEVTTTRRFRAELELGQAVIDSLDDSVAVFSQNGALAMANRSYRTLWGIEDTAEAGFVNDAIRLWMGLTAPTPAWGDLRDFVAQTSERAEWTASVRMRDGRGLHCRFLPIDGGATLTRFRLISAEIDELDQARRAQA